MGIKGLAKLLGDLADDSYKNQEMKNYFGRKIAIDASMALYQFLIAIRQDGPGGMLTDEFGESTSHLNGLFYRTINMLEKGIKPVYVFDGKPPSMKSGELKKRTDAKNKAKEEMEKALQADDQEAAAKFERRLTRVTDKHNQDAKKLLHLMGCPTVSAPCEAEAQCAELCKGGKVFATATEDMDALTFGTPLLVRNLSASQAKQKVQPIRQYCTKTILESLDFTMDQFIDMCILCGCDYTNSIKGIGPKKAYQFIKQHGSIEEIVKHLDKKKYIVPEGFMYKEARELFRHPEVTDAGKIELKWTDPDREGLIQFMVTEKGFDEARIRKGTDRIFKSKKAGNQKRLESFFGAVKVTKKRKKPQPKTTKGRKKMKKTKG